MGTVADVSNGCTANGPKRMRAVRAWDDCTAWLDACLHWMRRLLGRGFGEGHSQLDPEGVSPVEGQSAWFLKSLVVSPLREKSQTADKL